MKRLAPLSVAFALCACAQADPGACGASTCPFSAVAVTYDVNKQAFKLAQVQVTTLSSLRHLQGGSGTVSAGGTVRVQTSAIKAGATPDALRAAFVREAPAQVDVEWNVLSDIVYPENYESLELLSTYYNVEKARKALAEMGLATLAAKPIVAHASLADENGLSPLPAGELYYAPLATFFAPATTAKQEVPPAFNLGAVAHALGHEAVQEVVWGGAAASAPELGNDDTARHLARSIAEGIGDYLGAAVSLDPRWFDHSLQQDADVRALDGIHCSTPDMLSALAVPDASTPYDPYPLGSVIAGALWEIPHPQTIGRALLASLPDLAAAAKASGSLTLAKLLDAVASRAGDDTSDLCAVLINRFAQVGVHAKDLPSCPTVTPRQECQ